MSDTVVEKKKRGRKPKVVKITEQEEKVPQKRGRKPKNIGIISKATDKKINLIDQSSKRISDMLDMCIIHLKVTKKDVERLKNKSNISNQTNIVSTNNFSKEIYPLSKKINVELSNQLYDINIPATNIETVSLDYIDRCRRYVHNENKNIDFNSSQSKRKVTKIMEPFENKWLEKSPYECWNCSEHFDNYPIGIPNEIDDDNRFHLYGNFCSFGCASRYLYETEKGEVLHERNGLLNLYASKMLGEPNYKIVMAKNRLTLKKYGGILSISQYRQMMKHKDKMINVYKPPLVPVLYLMEEFVEDVNPYIRKNSKPVSLDDKKSDEAVARNKLVVSKQKSSGITIENCMKIKKK